MNEDIIFSMQNYGLFLKIKNNLQRRYEHLTSVLLITTSIIVDNYVHNFRTSL